MNKENINLFKRYINNQCSPQELEQVLKSIEEGTYSEEWDAAIMEEAERSIAEDTVECMDIRQKKTVHSRIKKQITKKKIQPIWIKYAVAGIVLFALAFSVIFYKNTEKVVKQNEVEIALHQDATPGRDVAVLTLGDGTKIQLDNENDGAIATQGNVGVLKDDGGLVYQSETSGNETPIINTLSTPRGGQYALTLPDGTKVWLNAASSISYPTVFNSNKREVEVKGEAYFEVVANPRKPFIVKTAGQHIEVLGTHFNVNAYEDEEVIKTTLIEGSVRIVLPSSVTSILKPGEQSLVIKGRDRITLERVETEAAVGWKNGKIYFDGADLKNVMRQLSRWYNVDVDLTAMPDKKLNGMLSRNLNLSVVLEAIEKTSNIKLKIENLPDGKAGRRILME